MERIGSLLCELGISTEHSIEPFYPRVRDRDDVAVLRCRRSGVILLSRSDHMSAAHYEDVETFHYWDAHDRLAAARSTLEDDRRRQTQFQGTIRGRKWIDVGTGAGGVLDLLAPMAAEAVAVEPQAGARAALAAAGYRVYRSLEDVPDADFEVVTLFHVFEHLTDPIATLATLRQKMTAGAKLIVEVPHARDFLLAYLDLEAFKAFTFWSEHLILHTRESLRAFLTDAGFSKVLVTGYQRYPLANHLHWLATGRPGGHVAWACLRSREVDEAYANLLASLDYTDTLIAVAET